MACLYCPLPLSVTNLPYLGVMCGACQRSLAGWAQVSRYEFRALTGKKPAGKSAWAEFRNWIAPNHRPADFMELDEVAPQDLLVRPVEDSEDFIRAKNIVLSGGLDKLTRKQQEAFRRVVMAGESLREVAEDMGISHVMVRKHVVKAGLVLRALVNKNA